MLYLIAGETSGDLHGSALLREIRKQRGDLTFRGIGGPRMIAEGLKTQFPLKDFQVMGFTDVLLALNRLRSRFQSVAEEILQLKPKAVIFIDYPGFNIRLAKHLRKRGYKGKLIHYIAPSVWAWGKKRIETMAKTLDLLLTIYPFEPIYFQETGLPVKYVGNPLIEEHPTFNLRETLQIPQDKRLIALFPGSRAGEIKRNFPLMLKTAEILKEKNKGLGFAISVSDEELLAEINLFLAKTSFKPKEDYWLIPESLRYACMKEATAALAKSGTVTLELALAGCPTVVLYKLSRMNDLLARYVFKVNLPYYSLPNILLGKTLFPEWMAASLDPKLLAEALQGQLRPEKRLELQEEALKLRELLTTQNASFQAAEEILAQC